MNTSQKSKDRFQRMVKEVSPNSAVVKNCVKAFFSGGLICCFGQFLTDVFGKIGASKDDAGMYTTAALIFLGVLLTGLGVYDKIGKHTGAGSVVPITGFANSMAAPAVEFKKEGMIMGIGAKMFLVAGPVIVYGLITSVAVGVLYYIFGR